MRSGIAGISGERYRGRHTAVLMAEAVKHVMMISKCIRQVTEMTIATGMVMGVWAAELLLRREISM